MCDVALPEAANISSNISRNALGVIKARMPAQGSVTEDPAGGIRRSSIVIVTGTILLLVLVIIVALLRRTQLAIGEEILEMGRHRRRLAMTTEVSHLW